MDSWMSASAVCACAFEPSQDFSFQRLAIPSSADVEVAYGRRLPARHVVGEKTPVLADAVATHRRGVLRHVALRIRSPGPRRCFVDGDAFTRSTSPLCRVCPCPGVHLVERRVALVTANTGPSSAAPVRVGPTTAISMMRSVSGYRPVISRSIQTRFWSLLVSAVWSVVAVIKGLLVGILAAYTWRLWIVLHSPCCSRRR